MKILVNTSGGTPIYSASFASPNFRTGGVATQSSLQSVTPRETGIYKINIEKSGGITLEKTVNITPVRDIGQQFQTIQTIPTQGIAGKGVGFIPFPSTYYTAPTIRQAGDKGQVIQQISFQPSKTEQQIIQQTLAEQNRERLVDLAQSQKVNQIRGQNFGQVSFGFTPVYNIEQKIPVSFTTSEGKIISQQPKIYKDFLRAEGGIYDGQANIKTNQQIYQSIGVKQVQNPSFTFGSTFDKQGNVAYNDINLSPRTPQNLAKLQEMLDASTTPSRKEQGFLDQDEFYSGGFTKPEITNFRFPISIGQVKVTQNKIPTAGPQFIEGFGVAGKIYQDTKNWLGDVFKGFPQPKPRSKETVNILEPKLFSIPSSQIPYADKLRQDIRADLSAFAAPVTNFKALISNEQNRPKFDELNKMITQYNDKVTSIEKEQDQEKAQQRIDNELKPLEQKINKAQQDYDSSYTAIKPTAFDKVLTASIESGAKAFGMSSSPYTTEQIWKKTFTEFAENPRYYGFTALGDAALFAASGYLVKPFEYAFRGIKYFGVDKAAQKAAQQLRPPPQITRTVEQTTRFKENYITPEESITIAPSGTKIIEKFTQTPRITTADDIVTITKKSTTIAPRPVTTKKIQQGIYELESTLPDSNKFIYQQYIGKSGKFGIFGEPQFQYYAVGPRSAFPKTTENIVTGPLSKEDQLRYGLTAIGKNEYKFLNPNIKTIEQLEKTRAISFQRATEKFTQQQIKGQETDFGDYFFSKRLERPQQPAESFNLFRTRGSFEPQRQNKLRNVLDPTYLGVKRFITSTKEKLSKPSKSQIKQYQDPFAAYTETYFGKTFGKTRPPIDFARIQKSLEEIKANKASKGKSQATETIKEDKPEQIIRPAFGEEQKTSFTKVVAPIIAVSRGYDFLGTIQTKDEKRPITTDYIETIYAFPESKRPKDSSQRIPIFKEREDFFTLPKFPEIQTSRTGLATKLEQNIRPDQTLRTRDLLRPQQQLTQDTSIIQKQIQNPFQEERLRLEEPQKLTQRQLLEQGQKFLQLQQFDKIQAPKFGYEFKVPAVGKIFPFGGVGITPRSFRGGGRVFKVFDVAKVPAGKVKVGVGYYEVSSIPNYEIKKRRKTKDEFFDIY